MKCQKYYKVIQRVFVFVIICFSCLSKATLPSQAVSCETMISNLNELAETVTKNARFSNSKEHTHLFDIYRSNFFESNYVTNKTLNDVMDILEEHPELSKPALREQFLTVEQKHYESPQSLKEVVQRLKNSANQFQSAFLQPEANIGFWQRLLMPLKKSDLEGLSNQEKKTKQKQHRTQFREYFDQVLTPEDRQILKEDNPIDKIEKTVSVYRILVRIRNQMIEEGRNVQALSQAMVDWVHTSGFRNSYYINLLKNQNAVDKIRGLELILKERNTVAQQLGFEGQFLELQRSLNVDHPIGSTKNENLSQILSDIQQEIQNQPYTIPERQVFKVRALSLEESPFRSCLGNDCTTYKTFRFGLSPNVIYFTLTDSEFKSSGQITVVLGTARSTKKKKRIKIAFVDKIQNIQPVMILPMLEAIRLSLAELDYLLGLRTRTDMYTVSNTEAIEDYMTSEVTPFFNHQLTKFKPHKHNTFKPGKHFSTGYSDAYDKPNILEFERWKGDFTISAGEIYTGSKIPEDLTPEVLFQEFLSLKDSDKEEDQIQFMSQLRLLTESEVLSKSFSKDYLNSKIENRQIPFKIRKKALYTLLEIQGSSWRLAQIEEFEGLDVQNREEFDFDIEDFKNQLKLFSKQEQSEILGELSNWKNSNDIYKSAFISVFSISFFKQSNIQDILNSQLQLIFNINAKNYSGESLLFMAVNNRDKATVEILLENGANIHERDESGKTALYPAVENRDKAMVILLLENGIKINNKDEFDETVLFPAVAMRDQTMVQLLLDHGVDPNARDSERRTALFETVKWSIQGEEMSRQDVEESNKAMAQLLLDHDADPHVKDFLDETILFTAVEESNKAMAQFFLDLGVDPHLKSFDGETLLFPAVRNDDEVMAEFLLNRGIDPNAKDRKGKTALYVAVEREFQDMTKLLLDYGADPKLEIGEGETILSLIERNFGPEFLSNYREEANTLSTQSP